MSYEVWVPSPAARVIRRIGPQRAAQIRAAIDELATDPRPRNSIKLRGRPGRRLRLDDYRIVYTVDDETRRVQILDAWHRQRGYR